MSALPPFPQTLPANTVVGRLGVGSGPSEAIPINTLLSGATDMEMEDFLTGGYVAANRWVRNRSNNLFDNANNGVSYGENYGVTAFVADGGWGATAGHNEDDSLAAATFSRETLSIDDSAAALSGVCFKWEQTHAATGLFPPRLTCPIYDVTRLSNRIISFGGRLKASTAIQCPINIVSFYGLAAHTFAAATPGQTAFTGLPSAVSLISDLIVLKDGVIQSSGFSINSPPTTTLTKTVGAVGGEIIKVFYQFGTAADDSPSMPVITNIGSIDIGTTFNWESITNFRMPNLLSNKKWTRGRASNPQGDRWGDYNLFSIDLPVGSTYIVRATQLHLFNGPLAPSNYLPDIGRVIRNVARVDWSTYPDGYEPGSDMTSVGTNGMLKFDHGLGTVAGAFNKIIELPEPMLHGPDALIFAQDGEVGHMTDLDTGANIAVSTSAGWDRTVVVQNDEPVIQGHTYGLHGYFNSGLSS